MKTLKFKSNINCGNCVASVTPFLNELDNVDMWRVDTESPDKILQVVIDDNNEQAVIDAVEKAGYSLTAI